MPSLLDDLRLLEAAQGYAELGLYMQANRELEQMSRETRFCPEVLVVKLAIFGGLRLWDMVEIIATQLARAEKGDPRWTEVAEMAHRAIRAGRERDELAAARGGRPLAAGAHLTSARSHI